MTGRDLLKSLPLFTELTPGGLLAREDVRDAGELAGVLVAVQDGLLRTEDFRVTGGGGSLLTGELLTVGLLLGMFVLEIMVLGGTL